VLTSLPGIGTLLAAEFLVTVGDTREGFTSADQLAAFAGLAPTARDSGKRAGDDRRMRGGNRALNWVFYQAAIASLRSFPESRAFYDRERVEGKMHNQVLIALTHRRVNVLWAMMRDDTELDAAFAA
jgi:transposase